MLHIITLAYRFDFLPKVYASIPIFEDIQWHLSIAQKRGIPNFDFIKNDERINIHLIDCEDNDFVTKRNSVFEKIKDGYFYMLDDDTIFLEEVYNQYKKFYSNKTSIMIVGNEKIRSHDGEKILIANKLSDIPSKVNVGTGGALATYDVLEHVQWSWIHTNEKYGRDHLFWSKCFKYFGPEKIIYCNEVISYHNYFGPLLRYRIDKKFKGKRILHFNLDINNVLAVKLLEKLTKVYFSLKSGIFKDS